MRKIILIAVILLAPVAKGQSIQPVIQQCARKCSGDFTVRNLSTRPMYVVLEPKSLSLASNGIALDRDLDSTTTLTLSESSARLSPMGEHRFSYRLDCPTDCAVQIFANMVVGRTPNGVTVRVLLPETIYRCTDGRPDQCRERFRLATGIAKGK